MDYTARLADFGYASLVGNIPEGLSYLRRSTVRPGALRWIAPEQIESEESFDRTPKSDVYSFGCITLQESWLNTNVRSALTGLQVLSGKEHWSEVREDAAVVLRLAKGQKPARPESRTLDDKHWDMVQRCWSSIEERPTAVVLISTIQQFLGGCPLCPPLRDLLAPWTGPTGSLPDESSPSQDSNRMVDNLDIGNKQVRNNRDLNPVHTYASMTLLTRTGEYACVS